MNLIKFIEEFPDEASCKASFSYSERKEGITCKKCGGTHHYYLKASKWEGSQCRTRSSLRSGTIMQASKLLFKCGT